VQPGDAEARVSEVRQDPSTVGKHTGWTRNEIRRDFAILVRLAVTALVIAITAYAIAGFVLALQDLDQRADSNSSISDLDRQYGTWRYFPKIIRDRKVVENARRSMPENATYRVLIGSGWKPAMRSQWSTSLERDFLRFYLLPRRQTDSPMANWAFCLACDLTVFPSRVNVLSRGRDGMLFLRVVR